MTNAGDAPACGYVPGILGRVTELHADYYARHWGFGTAFERTVAQDMAEFLGRYDAGRDGLWHLARDGRIEAAIAIDGIAVADAGAHLRWFIASDALRGSGAGRRLLACALAFCDRQRYPQTYLWTFRGLEQARHLYEQAGFTLAGEASGSRWGSEVVEQRWVRPCGGSD